MQKIKLKRRTKIPGILDLVDKSIARLQTLIPPEGYYGAFSGGKDSIVMEKLCQLSGVKVDWHYNVTTIDPPDLIYFIRKYYPNVQWSYPDKPYLHRLVEKGFPLRIRRWCCEEYKEKGGKGRRVLTGVRWEESIKRRDRRLVEACLKDGSKMYVHPIIDWTAEDVWKFIKHYEMPYCSLYDKGWDRVGCLFCPMESPRVKGLEMLEYPRYLELFIKYFEKLYQAKYATYGSRWRNGREMFGWYLFSKSEPKKDYDRGVIFE